MIGLADSIHVESVVLVLDINQDGIVLAIECAPNGRRPMIGPNDFIQQVICAKDFIKQQTRISIRMPVKMKIKRAVRSEQAMHQSEPLIKEIQIGIQICPVILISV